MGQGNTILILDNIPNYIRVLIAEDLATVHEQWKSSMLKKNVCYYGFFAEEQPLMWQSHYCHVFITQIRI